MNKFRSGFNAGCSLLIVAGIALQLAFKPIHSSLHWLAEKPHYLKIDPAALMAIEASALFLLGPLLLGAIIQILSKGPGRAFIQILSFWLAGLKFGIVCLLLYLPALLLRQILDSPDTPTASPSLKWLYILLTALLCISAPFWALLILRYLPAAAFRGTLFERFKRRELLDSGSEPLQRP